MYTQNVHVNTAQLKMRLSRTPDTSIKVLQAIIGRGSSIIRIILDNFPAIYYKYSITLYKESE